MIKFTEAGNILLFKYWLLAPNEAILLIGIWAAGALAVIALMWATYHHAWARGYRTAVTDTSHTTAGGTEDDHEGQ